MKKLIQENKIIWLIIALIIIAGTIVILTLGFNFELKYAKNNSIQINIDKQNEIEEIKKIAKEILKDKEISVEYVEEFKDTVCITTTEISEEEKESLIEKINEKYELEYKSEDFEIIANPEIKLFDILKQYILPISITSAIVILYFTIIYRKIGYLKVIVQSILTIILSQVILFSLIAITRFPIGIFTLTLIITIYIISISYLINKFEKEKSNFNLKDKKD